MNKSELYRKLKPRQASEITVALLTKQTILKRWTDERGTKYFVNGNGKVKSVGTDGLIQLYQHGKLHSLKSPAVLYARNGRCDEQWFYKGVLHRDDGPACTEIVEREIFPRAMNVNGEYVFETDIEISHSFYIYGKHIEDISGPTFELKKALAKKRFESEELKSSLH